MNYDLVGRQGMDIVTFATPKPLGFIYKHYDRYRVYILCIDEWRYYRRAKYYEFVCPSYRRARRQLKEEINYFSGYEEFYNWPVK